MIFSTHDLAHAERLTDEVLTINHSGTARMLHAGNLAALHDLTPGEARRASKGHPGQRRQLSRRLYRVCEQLLQLPGAKPPWQSPPG